VTVLVSAGVTKLPDAGFVPDHPPDALQAVAFVDDHTMVVIAP
jgi:hypothetical protein